MSKRVIELIDRLDLRAEEFRVELGAEQYFSRQLRQDLDTTREKLRAAERERDELRQQLEACNARDKYQPGGLIKDLLDRPKAWEAGRPHFCTIGEGEDDELQWTVKCRGCTYARMYLSYDMATLMKDAHEAGRESNNWWQDYPSPIAYQYLTHNKKIRIHAGKEFVKLTEDNAGLIMAAFLEQVEMICVYEDAALIQCPQEVDGLRYTRPKYGEWLRVHDDHLTPATDEEVKALEGEEQ